MPESLARHEAETKRAPKYLAWLRQQRCIVCDRSPCEAAHVRSGTDGGMGLKPSDMYAVPLCNNHHRQQHQIGESRFGWAYSINMLKEAGKHWRRWNDNF